MPWSSRDIQQADFAAVARRLRGWTGNLLATAAILVGGVSFGRQLICWMSIRPQEHSSTPLVSDAELGIPDLGDPGRRHEVDFGSRSLALRRQLFRGNKTEMFAALRGLCRSQRGSAPAPAGEPGPMEARLLEQLSGSTPAERAAGAWTVYQQDGPLPMVAQVGDDPRRVLAWGLALPIGDEGREWALFGCLPADAADDESAGITRLRAPSFGRRLMAVRAAEGGEILAFAGGGPAERWAEFFGGWFRREDWTAIAGWQRSGDAIHGRFHQADLRRQVIVTIRDRDPVTAVLVLTAPGSDDAGPPNRHSNRAPQLDAAYASMEKAEGGNRSLRNGPRKTPSRKVHI